MNTIPNPDNWMDVFTILAVALIAAVPSWLTYKNHKVVKDIKNQVVNGHEQPLRFDIDRALSAIEALTVDVRSLRTALMQEEDHRRIQINDLRDEIEHANGKRRHIL